MPIQLERLPDEPIVIATLSGHITADDVKTMYRSLADLFDGEMGTFHRVTDVRAAETDFTEMVKIIQRSTQEMPASVLDRRIQVTYVGDSAWINFARDAFLKRGVTMSAFEDMETALQSVRIRIAAEEQKAVH